MPACAAAICAAVSDAFPLSVLCSSLWCARILLSEASTAREAMALLTRIYETVGANGGGSVIVGDADEVWYIENHSELGTTYIQANRKFEIQPGDVIVLGDRRFTFETETASGK